MRDKRLGVEGRTLATIVRTIIVLRRIWLPKRTREKKWLIVMYSRLQSMRCSMLGHKAREFKQHQSISLEDLVPDNNFYRQVEQSLDFSFVRDLADEFYSSMGR